MNYFKQKYVQTTLELTEDFIDLIENHWISIWGFIITFFLQMYSTWLSIQNVNIQKMQDGFFKSFLQVIRLSQPGQLMIYLDIEGLNTFFEIIFIAIMLIPQIKILYATYIFKKMNSNYFIVKYFASFNYITFIPLTQFFSSLIQRGSETQRVLSIIGLPLILANSFYIQYITRNHIFADSNLSRKKYSLSQNLFVILNFIGLMVYQSEENQNLSVIIFHIGMLLLFFEYFWCFPLSNPYISSLYFKLMCVVESDTILMTVVFNQSWSLDNDYGFLYIVIKVLIWNLSGSIFEQYFMNNIILSQDFVDLQFQKYKREKLISEEKRVNGYLNQRKTKYIDVYSEYIFLLSQSSLRSQKDKMQLIYIITYHKKNCINLSCQCQSHKFYLFQSEKQTFLKKQNFNEIEQNDNQSIMQNKINQFIEVLLRENLRHRLHRMAVQQKEVVILKLISFVSRVLDNPPKAYYDLKIFAALNNRPSFHFESLFSVISYAIQIQIIKKQSIYLAIEEVNVKGQNNQSSQQSITLENMMEQLNQQEIISAEIKLIIILKIQFWNTYLNGEIVKFKEVQDRLIKAILKLNRIIKVYEQILQTVHSQSIISARLIQLYHMMVTRDVKEIKKCEHNFEEMIRRDTGMPQELLTALKVLENEIVILISTLLNNKGKLLNRKTPHMANFFHYNFESFDLIENVKQLMPSFLSQIHDGLMENYINRGYSTLIKSKERSVFIIDANRFIRPVNISFENIFEYKDDFNIIAALVKQKTEKQQLIFDITGRVQGASKQIYQSIKEKSDFIQQMDNNNNKKETLTINQFFNELFIFMIIPNIITQINQFLEVQRKNMEDAHYTDFGELSIMKYLIQTGQKNIEIIRYEKCELYVPQNLEFFKEQFKQVTENELNLNFQQMEFNTQKHENIVQFVKGFCMFDQKNMLRIEEIITNQMIKMHDQNFFKYYLKVNLTFNLLAQEKYTTRNHAFFTLQIIDKKIHENMFENLKDIRQNLKKPVHQQQQILSSQLQIKDLKKHTFSKITNDSLRLNRKKSKSLQRQSFNIQSNQLIATISSQNQLKSIENIFNAQDDCESENYLDEDFTEKSSIWAQSQDQFQQKKIEIINDEQIDGGSIDLSSQKDSVKLGGQFLQEIFSSQRSSKGENKFTLLNICLVFLILGFHIAQIVIVNTLNNQQQKSQNILEIQLELEMNYDQIIASQSLHSLVPYMKGLIQYIYFILDPERKAKWENITNNYFLIGQSKFNKIISDNRDFFYLLHTVNQTGDVQGKILDANLNQTQTLFVGYSSMLQMVSTSLEGSKSSNQIEKQQSNYLIQENYFEIHFLLDKNNVKMQNSFGSIQQQFNDAFIIVNALFITIITIILIGSIFASREYNNYFEHLLKTITLIKIDQIYVEIKRLNRLNTVLSDKYHLWISQNIFHLYFNQNTFSSNSTSKEDMRKQRESVIQIRYKTKYRTNSLMIIYFLFFFFILICLSTVGGVLFYSLQKDLSLNQQNHEGQFLVKMNLSNFIHMFTLYMAQSILTPGDPMLKDKVDLEMIYEEILIFRRDLKDAQDQFTSYQTTNSVLEKYLENNLCYFNLTDEILEQSLQNLCTNDLARAHLSLGINDIIVSMSNLQFQDNVTYMVENIDVEFLLWQYYGFTKPLLDVIMNELRIDMNQQQQRIKDSIIVFEIFGILFAILLSYIAYFTSNYFRRKRKENSLLLSLIPNEMLCIENTMNLLKKLQNL